MPADFYPKRELDILSWSATFRKGIVENYALLGISQEQAANYAHVQQTYADRLHAALAKSSNSTSAVQAKNTAKRELEKATRLLAGIIRTRPFVTAAQRLALGLPPRDAGRPAGSHNINGRDLMKRLGPPRLSIARVEHDTIHIRLRDPNAPLSAQMPRGVNGANIYSYAGPLPNPPGDLDQWQYEDSVNRANAKIRLCRAHPPGTRVWLTATWNHGSGERSAACEPRSVYMPYALRLAA